MGIYLVSSRVRGSGKTTLATNLAEALSHQAKTILLDIDEKQSAYAWANQSNRDFDAEHLFFDATDAEIFKKRIESLSKHYKNIVIDADGQDNAALRSVMLRTDKLIIPIRSSVTEEHQLIDDLLEVSIAVKQFNPALQIYILINKVTAQQAQHELAQAKNLLKFVPVHFLNTMIFEDQNYQIAMNAGQSIWMQCQDTAKKFDAFVKELQA